MDSEVTQLKEQMLVLRNANLTQHEREGVHAAELSEDAFKDTFGFLSTMNAVESEILALDTMLESGAFDHDMGRASWSSGLVCGVVICSRTFHLLS